MCCCQALTTTPSGVKKTEQTQNEPNKVLAQLGCNEIQLIIKAKPKRSTTKQEPYFFAVIGNGTNRPTTRRYRVGKS